MWYVYILECRDGSFYTGISTNLKKRIDDHNNSKLGAKYTRGRRPVKLVYSCEMESKSEALKEEYRIKKMARKEKMKLVKI
jgi:putative endonuclease